MADLHGEPGLRQDPGRKADADRTRPLAPADEARLCDEIWQHARPSRLLRERARRLAAREGRLERILIALIFIAAWLNLAYWLLRP